MSIIVFAATRDDSPAFGAYKEVLEDTGGHAFIDVYSEEKLSMAIPFADLVIVFSMGGDRFLKPLEEYSGKRPPVLYLYTMVKPKSFVVTRTLQIPRYELFKEIVGIVQELIAQRD